VVGAASPQMLWEGRNAIDGFPRPSRRERQAVMPKTSEALRVRGARGLVVALAILSMWLAAAPAGAQTFGAAPGERRILPPPALGAPPSTSLSPGDQLQMQLYRDELQTRQRQFEDRGGTGSPLAGMRALHNEERLNAIGR
jgi:hypothetical protein